MKMKKESNMKKVLASLLIAGALVAPSAHANGYGYRGGWGHGGGNAMNWVVPATIGGLLVYGATRPQQVIVQQPVYIPQPVYVQQPQPAGVPYGYHYENILDANCNCYRIVMVPN